MNTCILSGRLTADPKLETTKNEKIFGKFTVAVNRPFAKDGDQQADFLNILCFGGVAENCKKYLAKGSQVIVEGSIQIHSYENKDKIKQYVTEIVANKVEFISTKKNESNGG
jgi:single-strand DNA-binding protein